MKPKRQPRINPVTGHRPPWLDPETITNLLPQLKAVLKEVASARIDSRNAPIAECFLAVMDAGEKSVSTPLSIDNLADLNTALRCLYFKLQAATTS